MLIVEDDDEHRREVRDILAESGYETVEAANGKKGLDYLVEAGGVEPSLILLDLHMPMMTGWEFLAIVKSYVRLARIPVVLVSGQAPHSEALVHGALAAHLRKPYTTEQLLAVAATHVRPKPA